MPRSGDDTRREPSDPVVAAVPLFAAATAREAAFQTLELVRDHSRRVTEAWRQVLDAAALGPLDRSLSRELALGVVRRELTLDVLLRQFVKRPLEEIEPPLKTILQLGLYQLFFADHIPPHAAVHETVELAKRVGRLRWSGFVNGILRAASRMCTEEFTETASSRAIPVGAAHINLNTAASVPSPLAGEGGRRPDEGELTGLQSLQGSDKEAVAATCPSPPASLPQGERSEKPPSGEPLRFRLLTQPVFPDPQTDLPGYFREAYGFPEWLAARWAKRWPEEALHRLGHWQRMPPPVFVRVNLTRTTREDLLQQFHAAGLHAVPAALSESVRVLSGGRIEGWPGYDAGLFSIQDLSAMRAARRLAPTPGSRVLDLCAAPGGKSCHLAELMGDAGDVLAVDVTPVRLERIVENATRLQLKAVQALLVTEDGHDLPRGPFDFILADVPCSNTGVIGRRPEVAWHLTPADIRELSRLQLDLLHRAADRLCRGGRLLYSTCSIESEEDELLVREFLQQRAEFRIVEEELLLPGAPADGGYQALLERMR